MVVVDFGAAKIAAATARPFFLASACDTCASNNDLLGSFTNCG